MNKIKLAISRIGDFTRGRTAIILVLLIFVCIVSSTSAVIFFITKRKITESKLLLEKDFEYMALTKEQCVNYMEKLEAFKKALDLELRDSERKMKKLRKQLKVEKEKNRELILEAKRTEDFGKMMKGKVAKYRKEKSDIVKRLETVNKNLDSVKADYRTLVAEKEAFTRRMEEMTVRLEELSKEGNARPFGVFGVR